MSVFNSSYYGLIRVSNAGPESKNWAVTDTNVETVSRLIKALELHHHNASTPITYPGYNDANPATPVSPTITESTTGGYLTPGTTVGVRLSYVDTYGLETAGSPEETLLLSSLVQRADSPGLSTPTATPVGGGLAGGTYLYVITKRKGSGETQVSDSAIINVPFTTSPTSSYYVQLTFAAINTYTDGTDAIRIYRSTGFNSAFVLVKTITTASQTTYTDTNILESSTTQPPVINTFDRTRKVTFTFPGMATPKAGSKYLRVYVTQQPLTYSTSSLLSEIDVTGGLPASVTYLGNEILGDGYPLDYNQQIGGFTKINLGQEATGAPILTEPQNFKGYQTQYFVFGDQNTATPINGNAYLDSSTNQFKIRVNGSYITLATPTGSFSHSTAEPGGHTAQNIFFSPSVGGPSVYTVLSAFATPVPAGAQWRKQIQTYQRGTVTTASYTTTSSTLSALPETTLGAITPQFAGQLLEMSFSGAFYLDPQGFTNSALNAQFEINGSTTGGAAETYRSVSPAGATPVFTNLNINYATPISSTVNSIRVLWSVTSGQATSYGPRRTTLAKLVA